VKNLDKNVNSIKKQKVICLLGPTAIGKSDLAIDLAKAFGFEIIGADSMQIYRGLDVGTGKVTKEQAGEIAHHMIDILDPSDEYSAGQFVKDAGILIKQIAKRKGQSALVFDDKTEREKSGFDKEADKKGLGVPLIVGGTGLYVQALLSGHDFAQAPKDTQLRQKLTEILKQNGAEHLHNLLKECDEVSAQKIFPNDTKRVIRALEVYYSMGKKLSDLNQINRQNATSEYDYLCIVLQQDRQILYERINKRVDKMVENGLIKEVQNLFEKYQDKPYQFCQAIGYKELFEHLRGNCTLLEAIENIKRNSRRYAKRQITFFKHMPIDKIFIDGDYFNQAKILIEKFLSA